MADLSITISNQLNVFTPTPGSKWGDLVWGQETWGESRDFDLVIGKWLSEGITLSDAYGKAFTIGIPNGISAASSMNLIALTDGSGYTYVEKGSSDPDDRLFPDYTEDSRNSVSYTEDTANDPSWSDA
jgi:hypothetical protein